MKPLLRTESWLALLIGLLFGVPAVVLVPPAVTFDGPSHYARALQVSEGHMRAERISERAAGGTIARSHFEFLNTLLWAYYWKPGHEYMDRARWEALSRQDERVPRSDAPRAERSRAATLNSSTPFSGPTTGSPGTNTWTGPGGKPSRGRTSGSPGPFSWSSPTPRSTARRTTCARPSGCGWRPPCPRRLSLQTGWGASSTSRATWFSW